MYDAFGHNISALYLMVQMQNSNRIVKFKTESIDSAIGYLQWHIRRYRHGLLLEIATLKKFYDWKTKSVRYSYE